MKKKIVIFRFGSVQPTRKEYAIIATITGGTKRAIGCGTPFGVISIVETEFTPTQITELFIDVAKESDDSLPVIVWDPTGDTGVNLCPMLFENFDKINSEFDEMFGDARNECTLSLDELLDLIKEKSFENLTVAELTRLKELSK